MTNKHARHLCREESHPTLYATLRTRGLRDAKATTIKNIELNNLTCSNMQIIVKSISNMPATCLNAVPRYLELVWHLLTMPAAKNYYP